MKKIIYTSLWLWSLMAVQITAEDRLDRQGWNFGLGASVLGGCYKDEIYDEESGDVIGHEKAQCLGFPIPHLYVGYGFTPQFKIGLESKTFLLAGTIELKGQYYFTDTEDSAYLHAESVSIYAIDWGFSETAVGLGVGYAQGHLEYELGIIHPSSEPLFSLGVKYLF